MSRFDTITVVFLFLATAVCGQKRYVFPSEVPPLLHTEWGQDAPYNKFCPQEKGSSDKGNTSSNGEKGSSNMENGGSGSGNGGSDRKNAYAGCGPLVMSQVMKGYNYPPSSPQLGSVYAWDKMYDAVPDTANVEGDDAIARLIVDCGTAAGTVYGASASATKLNEVVTGLKKYFGYNRYMAILDRAHYKGEAGSRLWNTVIYDELRNGRPVIVRGERDATTAHVFIIDGCRDSTVHVNWGWAGKRNGYYDPDSLYGYRLSQRMVVDIAPQGYVPQVKSISTGSAGRLSRSLNKTDRELLRHIKVVGPLNRADIAVLRQMATAGNLCTIDLSEAVILTLPDSAFYGCANLTYISLPLTLPEISAYAFASCTKLNRVDIHSMVSEIKQNAFYGCFYLTDIRLPFALKVIGANAFNSCNSLTNVKLPPMLTTLGTGAFANAKSLQSLTMPKSTAKVGADVVKGTKVNKIRRL